MTTEQAVVPEAVVPDGAVRVLGGEMISGTDGVPSIGASVLHFLQPLLPPTGRVLVAGPHPAELVEHLAARGLEVDVLMRRINDANEAAIRSTSRRVRVFCGDPIRHSGSYELVLSLDGVDRIAGPDSVLADWESMLDRLASLVAPAGTLCVLVGNRMRGQQLISGNRHSGGGTSDRGDAFAAGYPALSRHLTNASLHVDAALAVYPSLRRAALVVHRDAFAPNDPVLATIVAASFAPDPLADGEFDAIPLTDPRRVARESVRNGLGFELAPAWLIIANRPTADRDNARWLPSGAVVDDRPGLPYWSAPQRIDRDDAGIWRRQVIDGSEGGPRGLGPLSRQPGLLNGPLPHGPLLDESMLAACAGHDMDSLRDLLNRYALWLRSTGAVFASTDNVVDAGDFELFDPSWSTLMPVRPEIVLLASMRRFADRLLSGAYPHPWPAGTSPDRLAIRLAAMAGIAATKADLDEASVVECELTGPLTAAAAVDPEAALARLAATYARPEPSRPRGYTEAVRALEHHRAQLAAAGEQLQWLTDELSDRDSRLTATGRELLALRGSMTYRLGYVILSPAHVLRRSMKRLKKGAAT